MQFEVAASERFKADAIGDPGRDMRSDQAPRAQRSDELHAGEAAELIPKAVGGADDRVVDHLQGDRLALTAVFRQAMRTRGIRSSRPASRRHGPLACKPHGPRSEHRDRRSATPAAILLVVYLETVPLAA